MPQDSYFPPHDFEAFSALVRDRFDTLSKTSQTIAVFLNQHPNDVAMLSLNAVANRCGVHASSFVRFAQALGYSGFKELQEVFHRRLSDSVPISIATARKIESAGGESPSVHETLLREQSDDDVAAIRALSDRNAGDRLGHAVRLLNSADTIYLIGDGGAKPVVGILESGLAASGCRVVVVPATEEQARHRVATMTSRDILFLMTLREPGPGIRRLAERAAAIGAPVVVASDNALSRIAGTATVTLELPGTGRANGGSLTASVSLAQALIGMIKAA